MKISEILNELATLGTAPTMASQSATSQTPAPGQGAPTTQAVQKKQTMPDPKTKQLATTLKLAGIVNNEVEVADFINAYSAKKANPDQEISDPTQANMIAKVAVARDPNLDTKINQQIQSLGKDNLMGKLPTAQK